MFSLLLKDPTCFIIIYSVNKSNDDVVNIYSSNAIKKNKFVSKLNVKEGYALHEDSHEKTCWHCYRLHRTQNTLSEGVQVLEVHL